MPRIRYARPDSGDSPMARVTASMKAMQKNSISAYAGARFQEWEQNAPEREAILQARMQKAQSEAELSGAQFRYNFWKDNELRRQTTAYYKAMPVLQERLKQAGIYPGSPRYAAEMSAFAAELPDAVTHNDAIRKELMDFSKTDKTASEIADKAKVLQKGLAQAGLKGTSFSSTASGDFDVKATRPINENLKSVNLSPTEFLNGVNHVQGKYDEKGKFTQSLKPGEQATAIQFQAGPKKDDASTLETHAMPLEQFNNFRSDLGHDPLPAYSAPGQGATPTPIPSATPEATQPMKHLGRYNPTTGEYE